MLRDGSPTGRDHRHEGRAGCVPDNQVELLKTFAEQAVIAIENVRLFTELQARTTQLRDQSEN